MQAMSHQYMLPVRPPVRDSHLINHCRTIENANLFMAEEIIEYQETIRRQRWVMAILTIISIILGVL